MCVCKHEEAVSDLRHRLKLLSLREQPNVLDIQMKTIHHPLLGRNLNRSTTQKNYFSILFLPSQQQQQQQRLPTFDDANKSENMS
jgi:hypothetical protein